MLHVVEIIVSNTDSSPLIEAKVGYEVIDGEKGKVGPLNCQET